MKLHDLCAAFEALPFPADGERAHPERALVVSARSSVEEAVIDDEFLADCFSTELRLIESNRLRRELTPFFTIPGLGVRLAFGYWPPGGTPGPHEHTAWTITAVCRNELEVLTYHRDESYRRRELVPKNRFPASAGRVGYIFDPCIHEPRNTSRDWTLSLHVSSPRDGEPPADQEARLPVLNKRPGFPSARDDDPYTRVLIARQQKRYVHQLSRIVLSMNVAQASTLLARCAALASSRTRRLIDRASPIMPPGEPEKLQRRLTRVHQDLMLSHRAVGDMVALDVDTSAGPLEEFVISDAAREAMAFVVKESAFEVRALPGSLSNEERTAIADALEDTGLFTRVPSCR